MKKRVIHKGWSWLMLFSFFLIFNCQSIVVPEKQEDKMYYLQVDQKTGRMSIKAQKTSLFKIIEDLKVKHQIEVIISDIFEDRIISVDISDKPLHEALAILIPTDLKYHFRARNIETVIPGNTGNKKALLGRKPKPKDLPTKDKTVPLGPRQKIIVKSKPEASVIEKHSEGDSGTKINPRRSEGTEGKGSKIPKTREPEGYRYARLNLFMDSNNNIRVEQFLEIEGRLVESRTYNGKFLYAAYMDNKIIAVGSRQDPLLVRSIDEQPGRLTTRAKQGFFSISLPEDFLNKDKLARAKMNFYFFEEDAGVPEEITVQTFLKIEKRMKTIASIGSQELLNSFSKIKKGGRKDE